MVWGYYLSWKINASVIHVADFGAAKCIIINWEIDIHVTLLTLYICNQRYMNKKKMEERK